MLGHGWNLVDHGYFHSHVLPRLEQKLAQDQSEVNWLNRHGGISLQFLIFVYPQACLDEVPLGIGHQT